MTDLPPPGPAAPPPLDAQALERLRQLDPDGRLGVLARVLRTYETSVQTAVRQLQEARDRGDLQAIRELAHKIKSSSAAVGALALAARCADTEARIRDGQPFDITRDTETLLAEADGALQAVRAMLPGQVPAR